MIGEILVEEVFGVHRIVHPEEHFLPVDGLGEEIAGPRTDALQPRLTVVERGDDQDRQMGRGRVLLDAAAHGITIQPRHHHIQQNHIGPLDPNLLQRLFAVLSFGHLVAGCLQQGAQQRAVEPLIIYHQDTAFGCCGHGRYGCGHRIVLRLLV